MPVFSVADVAPLVVAPRHSRRRSRSMAGGSRPSSPAGEATAPRPGRDG
jgi:hypothetical protein